MVASVLEHFRRRSAWVAKPTSEVWTCAFHTWRQGREGKDASEKPSNLLRKMKVWACGRQGSRGRGCALCSTGLRRPLPIPSRSAWPLPPCSNQSQHKALLSLPCRALPSPPPPGAPKSLSSVLLLMIRSLFTWDRITSHTSDVSSINQTIPLRPAALLC